MPKAVFAALAILASSAADASGQSQKAISQFTHTAWTPKDGVGAPVRALAQTLDGYLWLGTEAGLYRFDGQRFVRWRALTGDQLPNTPVWSLCAARDGSLWVGLGSAGISHISDEHVHNYTAADGVPRGGVLSIAQDHSGAIWAGGQYGFSRFDARGWHSVGAEMGYPAPGAQALFVDQRGTLWTATDGFNFGLSPDHGLRNTVLTLAAGDTRFKTTGQPVAQVWSITGTADGNVWIADSSREQAVAMSGTAREAIPLDAGPTCLVFDGTSVWVGLNTRGLRRVPWSGAATIRQADQDRFELEQGLSGSPVYTALRDREGSIWFGTAGGLDRFRDNKVTPFSVAEGLNPDQQIGLATSGSSDVRILSYASAALRRLRGGHFLQSTLPEPGGILSLFVDPAGTAWAGGSFGLAREDGDRLSYVHRNYLRPGDNVEAITIDSEGSLWLGITEWRPETGTGSRSKIARFQNGGWTEFGGATMLPAYRTRVMYADARGRTWIGYENGEVAVYDRGTFHVFTSKEGLPAGRVLTIASDRGGTIWIGGEAGLSRFDGERFASLSQDAGLPGNSVSGFVEDADGRIWLACSLGIVRVTAEDLHQAFTSPGHRLHGLEILPSDGLRGLPRLREPFPTAVRAADGRLWFATSRGVAVIDPRELRTNTVVPPIVIESVKADGQTFRASSASRLPALTKTLEFTYTALSLADADRVRFRYRLEGYDNDWRDVTPARRATYTNLPPRDYRFRVIGSNNDGVWNEVGSTFAFTILPAFYQTLAFRLLVVAVIAAASWGAYRMRLRQLARQMNLRFEERLAERTRIAQELHDTLLQGFISASMQVHVAAETVAAHSPARPALTQSLDLMRRVIDEGRNAVRGLRAAAADDDLERAFTRIAEEVHAGGSDFHVRIEGRDRRLNPMTRDEVYHIGREAVINAFRHAHAQRIELWLDYARDGLRLSVRDNGRGIDPEVLRAGSDGHWGLAGMRERAERAGARFNVRSSGGAGTTVELYVPARTAYARENTP